MNGIYFCKLFLESTFTFANWNLNLQLTKSSCIETFSLSKCKSEVHAPSFYAFALQMLFDARCHAYCDHPHRQKTFSLPIPCLRYDALLQ